jgi:hypothetical protein
MRIVRPSALVLTLAVMPVAAAAQDAAAVGIVVEPGMLTKAIKISDRWVGDGREPGDGFYVELGNMITGAGWVSAARRSVLRVLRVFRGLPE